MRATFVNGELHVTMPEPEFAQLVEQAKVSGITEGKRQAELSMMANGTQAKAKRPAKRTVAKRKKSIPRPAMRGKRKQGKKRDWSAIVAKRLATQKANREARRAQQAPVQQAEAL